MIEALTSERTNYTLNVRNLPRRSRRREDLVDLHRHDVRECRIAVVQQVPRRVVLGKGVAELLGRLRLDDMLAPLGFVLRQPVAPDQVVQ